MGVFVVVGILLIYYFIFNLSPVKQVISDVRSRYFGFECYSKVEVKDKDIYVIHDRLIFEMVTEIEGVSHTLKVTPKDFNAVEKGDIIYIILNSYKAEICDISKSEEELFEKIETLEKYPLSIKVEEMEVVQDV